MPCVGHRQRQLKGQLTAGVEDDGDPKVPVFLANFAADIDGDRVALRWTVAESSDQMDFHVLRAEAKSDLFHEVIFLQCDRNCFF